MHKTDTKSPLNQPKRAFFLPHIRCKLLQTLLKSSRKSCPRAALKFTNEPYLPTRKNLAEHHNVTIVKTITPITNKNTTTREIM